MSTTQLVLKLVRQSSAERGATPVPILHVSSYSSEHMCICLSLSKQNSQGKFAGKAAMYYVLPAYDSFTIICIVSGPDPRCK